MWLEDLNDLPRAVEEEEEDQPLTDLFGNDDDDDDNHNNNNNINNAQPQQLLATLITQMSTQSHLDNYPVVVEALTVDSLIQSNRQFASFYNRETWAPLHPIVKLLFSASGSSASKNRIYLLLFF